MDLVESRAGDGKRVGARVGVALAGSVESELEEITPDHIAALDGDGQIIAVNAAWQGYCVGTGGGVGSNYFDFCSNSSGVPLPESSEVLVGVQSIFDGDSLVFSFEYPCHLPREERWFSMIATPLKAGKGALVSHRNITERRSAENAAGKIERLAREIDGSLEAIFLCDEEGIIRSGSSAFGNLFGLPLESLIDRNPAALSRPELETIVLNHNSTILKTGENREFEISVNTASGTRLLQVTKGRQFGSGGKVQGIWGNVRDITEIRWMERKILNTVDKEKQRFADHLHENLCQVLVGISLLGNALDEELLRMQLHQAHDARQIVSLAKEAVLEVKGLVKQLSPMPLSHGGSLAKALMDLAEQAKSTGKVKCSFRAARSVDCLDAAIGMHLYRIAQEAVHNAIRHGNAKRLSIRLAGGRGGLVLTIRDNGVGFTPQEGKSSGIGLQIMHSRARVLQATLEFRKLPVRGMAVICSLPGHLCQPGHTAEFGKV